MSHVYSPLPPTDAKPPDPPAALTAHPVVIVGGGPVGLLAACLLAQRSLDVIVVERTDLSAAPTGHSVTRAYSIALMSRAFRVLSLCPELNERVEAASVVSSAFRIDGVGADGKHAQLCIDPKDKNIPPFRYILRSRLVATLRDYVATLRNVTVLDHTDMAALDACADGTIKLTLSGRHREAELITRLVLACDGKRSPTLAELRADKSGLLTTTNGLGERSWDVPSSGKQMRSIVLSEYVREFISEKLKARNDALPSTAGLMLGGLQTNRPANRFFSFVGLPVTQSDAAVLGGDLVTVMAMPDNAVFAPRDVDEAYSLLQENFPQIDARRAFAEENVRRFVDERTACWPLGPVRRVDSLSVSAGRDGGCGGVVFLGEAAHSFPPDIGQGLNSGFEDVGVLAGVIDCAEGGASAGDIVRAYERVRDEDTDGLMFVHRVAAMWQFGQPLTLGGVKFIAGTVLLSTLSSMLPRVFDPPVNAMLLQSLSYGETMRRAERTTRRIYMVVVLMTTVLAIVAQSVLRG